MQQEQNRGARGNRGGYRGDYRGQRGNRGWRGGRHHHSQENLNVADNRRPRGGGGLPFIGHQNRGRGGFQRQEAGEREEMQAQGHHGNAGRVRSSSQQPNTGPRHSVVNFRTLKLMEETVVEKLVGEISMDSSGFPQAMNNQNLHSNDEAFQLMVSIVLKAVAYDSKAPESNLLLSKLKSSSFLSEGFSAYYTRLLTRSNSLEHIKAKNAFAGSVNLLKIILEKFPSSLEKIIPPYSMITLIVSQNETTLNDNVKKAAVDLSLMVEGAKEKYSSDDKPQTGSRVPLTPPNNFREMGIFPSFDKDLACSQEPYLRPIEIKGGFQDIEHYLDVHFRLLREDFVAPLRNGIREYLELSGKDKSLKRLTEVRVYKGVQILNPMCQQAGLVYRIQFDASNFKRINWKTTKRFIYGSLLCLSNNNFEDVVMATVENRKPEDLAKGVVQVRFEDESEPLRFSGSETFVMLETMAFFEAYRHVLECLISIAPERFPFQDAIVHCSPTIRPPRYLNALGARHFSLKASTGPDEEQIIISDENGLNVELAKMSKTVDILNENLWPSAASMGLDDSQLKALKNCLTSSLSVIQGPPGTGKTFLGLKIVEILLHNWERWNVGLKPILVVCYTNHALDQFLEGIHKFLSKGIVRIGGRSKSESMKQFNLSQLRYEARNSKNLPREIFSSKHSILQEMKRKQDKIERVGCNIEMLERGIVDERQLSDFMLGQHRYSLTSVELMFGTSYLLQWLQINGNEEMLPGQDDLPLPDDEDEGEGEDGDGEIVNVENEADLEEHMRRMDNLDIELRLKNLELEERRKINMKSAEKELAFNLDRIQQDREEWETQKGQKKNLKKRIKRCLTNADAMSEREVEGVADVWRLSLKDKWRLYRHWLNRYKAKLKGNIFDDVREYGLLCDRLRAILSNEDEWIMREARVIGMTTTCAARNRKVLTSIKPTVVIVEEAAEVLESHVVASLTPDCQHLVLIGDHKQLRPSANVYKLGTRYHLNCSLFERLVTNNYPYVTLERQHRMRPEIADFARITYPLLRDDPSVLGLESVRGVSSNVFFINHHQIETQDGELLSAYNLHEAMFLARFSRYLIQQGYSQEQITILTPYSGQMYKIRDQMPRNFFQGLQICPVDNYQGEENDIVLLSLVRSNYDDKIGFLKESNRINVAMTRARKGLYVIGNFDMLTTQSDFLRKIYRLAVERGTPVLGTRMHLSCQNHPGTRVAVANDKDFDQVPEGGCTLPCRFRLPCGHTCTRSCHPYDRDHSEFQCLKPCQKIHEPCKHACTKRCYEVCGRCQVEVVKTIPRCLHYQKMACHVSPGNFTCREKCSSLLPCGHACTEICGKPHTEDCQVGMLKGLDCGHQATIPCYRLESGDFECTQTCRETLKCGHPCPGTCGRCLAGRVHARCTKGCERSLVCGHSCKSSCSDVCPPCQQPCDVKCGHSECSKQCGQPCDPCNERCSWSCVHHKCSGLCHEECDRPRCNSPCRKRLPCGHLCVGLCGEACPPLCRTCHAEQLLEVFFGTEDGEDARFIRLADCIHVLEVTGMDRWVAERVHSSAIVPLCCPKCKTPVQKSKRYRAEIKSVQGKIERVKQRICGTGTELAAKRRAIVSSLENIGEGWSTAAIEAFEKDNCGIVQMDNVKYAVDFIILLKKLSFTTKPEIAYRNKLKDRIVRDFRSLSTQECEEMQLEIARLELLKVFLECKPRVATSPANPRLTEELKKEFLDSLYLLQTCKLDREKEDKFREVFKKVKESTTGLGITEAERVQIVNAMNIKSGAWFECPNGHVYAIGDCGGATQEGRCNECDAAIGGVNHALRRDNRWNRVMDGARATAWPGTLMNPN